MSEKRKAKRKRRPTRSSIQLPSPFIRDDQTGLLTMRPGIETDRELYKRLTNFDGEGLPPHPDADAEPIDLVVTESIH